jgi:nudix-type nucleoside diphosphatase (YffH/AdpP family)
VVQAKGADFPLLVPDHHGRAVGILVDDVTKAEDARLAWYEFGYARHELRVAGAKAFLYLAQPGLWEAGEAWDLVSWQASDGEIARAAAQDLMTLQGHVEADAAARAYPMMVQRAASRLRAKAEPFADQIRRPAAPVEVTSERLGWLGYFAVRESDLRFGRFDGNMSNPVTRAGFLMGDAVTVLPYDPKRDLVLVVEQFRFGPFLRGDHNPWTLEPIAGRIDPGESPEDAARREALEEAGLTLGRLIKVAQYYPSPGAVSEYLYSYIAICDLPDDLAGTGGLDSEDEDIKAHLLSFDALMDLVATPEASNGPLILTAHALAGLRSTLVP